MGRIEKGFARLMLAVATSALTAAGVAAQPAGTMVVAVPQEPQDLAAQGAYKEINAAGIRNVVETLLATNPETGAMEGILATGWERIDDSTLRVTIRDGVTFHDGTPMDAEAVATSINFVWSPDNAFTIQEYAGPGVITARATGPLEVEVSASAPDPMLEFRLTLNGITSAQQIAEDPSAHFDTPIGTGPYRFVEWQRGQFWSAEVNPDWWGLTAGDAYGNGPPLFAELRFVFRSETSARTAMVRAGEAQLAVAPSPEDCAAAADAAGYSCISSPSDAYLYGRLDQSIHADARLQDMRVRQAIFHAIDYEGLADLIGVASVPNGQLGTPDMLGYNDSLSQYAYDPDLSRRLLDEARADGVDVDGLVVEVVGRDTTSRIGSVTEVIGFFLGEVGINTSINVQSPDLFNPRVRISGYAEEAPRAMMQVHVKQNASGEFGTNLLGNYACPDIDDPSGASRSSVYCNPDFDARLAEALTLSGDARHAALRELVGFLYEQYPIIPLALLDRAYLLEDGYEMTVGVDHRFQAVYITRTD